MLVKNHITNFLFIIFMMMTAFVSSCTLDELTEETGRHDAATVLLTLNVADGPVTRSLSSSNENTVNDLTVLVFDSGKRLIGSTYVGGLSTTTSTTATVTTRVATGCTVYAIANTGSASFFAGVNTVEELNAKYTTLTSAAALMNGNNVLMAGSVSADIKDGSNSISIPIKHLCSKINISIVPSSGITITGYQLCYAALGCYITDSHSSAGSAVTAPANGSGNSYGNFDAVTLSSPTAGTTVTPPVYYVYENLAGSNSKCTTEKLRTSANAPANSMYLLVYAKTRSWHSTYRIYLGGVTNASTPVTDLTNFNVYRNLNYTYTVSITGSGQSDARVTYAADYVAPSIGDIYYSDGTWSSTLEESKTPIGIIFSTTTSATDYSNGYTHGYVMALKDATSNVSWCIPTASYVSKQLHSSLTNTVELEESNCDGLTETNNIISTTGFLDINYPACYYAVKYSIKLPSKGTSGWYLPSVGQWYLILKNLGGVTTAASRVNGPNNIYNYAAWLDKSYSAADGINVYLNKAGSSNVETIVCNASTTCCYLSSSEITKEYANYVYFDKNGGLGLGVSEKYLADAHNHVRPVIAF